MTRLSLRCRQRAAFRAGLNTSRRSPADHIDHRVFQPATTLEGRSDLDQPGRRPVALDQRTIWLRPEPLRGSRAQVRRQRLEDSVTLMVDSEVSGACGLRTASSAGFAQTSPRRTPSLAGTFHRFIRCPPQSSGVMSMTASAVRRPARTRSLPTCRRLRIPSAIACR